MEAVCLCYINIKPKCDETYLDLQKSNKGVSKQTKK